MCCYTTLDIYTAKLITDLNKDEPRFNPSTLVGTLLQAKDAGKKDIIDFTIKASLSTDPTVVFTTMNCKLNLVCGPSSTTTKDPGGLPTLVDGFYVHSPWDASKGEM